MLLFNNNMSILQEFRENHRWKYLTGIAILVAFNIFVCFIKLVGSSLRSIFRFY